MTSQVHVVWKDPEGVGWKKTTLAGSLNHARRSRRDLIGAEDRFVHVGRNRARAIHEVEGRVQHVRQVWVSQRRRILRRGRRGSLTNLVSWRCPGIFASPPLALPDACWPRSMLSRNNRPQYCPFKVEADALPPQPRLLTISVQHIFGSTISVLYFCSSDAKFQQSASCRVFGPLEHVASALSQ